MTILNVTKIKKIHDATIDILNDTGIRVPSKTAQKIYYEGGCHVDSYKNTVKIPSSVIEKAIKIAPEKILLAGRSSGNDYLCGPEITFTNFAEGVKIVDIKTKRHRATTKKDVSDIARMCDNMDLDICVKGVGANDVPPQVKAIHMAEAMFNSTTKHCIIGGGDAFNCKQILKMAAICVGGMATFKERPLYSASFTTSSPLALNPNFTEPIIELAPYGVPIKIMTMPLSGATGPVTMAGTLIIANAEFLSGLVLGQLINRGLPMIYGSAATIMDLRFSTAAVGSPEIGQYGAAIAEMAKFYGVPSFVAGCWADSKVADAQAAHESTITGMMAGLSGANIIFGLGALEQGLTFDYAKFIMDIEISKMIKKAISDVVVDDETLALDIIKEIGASGEFLSHNHTYQLFRREHSFSKLFNRQNYDEWAANGATKLTERAYDKANELFSDKEPQVLPKEVSAELKKIVKEAESHYGLEPSGCKN